MDAFFLQGFLYYKIADQDRNINIKKWYLSIGLNDFGPRLEVVDAIFVPMFNAMFVPMFVSKWCSRWVVGMPIFVWNPLKVEIILDHGCLLYMPKPENFQIGFTKKSVSISETEMKITKIIFFISFESASRKNRRSTAPQWSLFSRNSTMYIIMQLWPLWILTRPKIVALY